MQLRWSALRLLVIWLGLVVAVLCPADVNHPGLLAQEGDGLPTSEGKEQRPGMDRFDMRAAEEPGQIERLSLVKKSFERQRWDEGILQVQSLLNEDQDSLQFGDDRVWRPVSGVVLDLIRQAPSEAQQAYVTRFGAIADRELAQARKTHDLTALLLITRRYLLTPAGQQASRELIEAVIDHGNRDSLAKLVSDLMLIESPQLQDARWRSQLVNVLNESGYSQLAQKLSAAAPLSDPPSGDEVWWTADSWGQPVNPHRDWLTLSGSPTGQGVAGAEESLLLPRWRQPLVSSPRVRTLLQNLKYKFEDQGAMGLSVLATVGSDEILVTRTLSNLTAVNVNSGKVLWTSREWRMTPVESDGEMQEIEQISELILDSDTDGDLTTHVVTRLTTRGSLGTLSTNSRHVFSLASFSPEETLLESFVPPDFDNEESEHPKNPYLHARDLNTGRIVWRAGGPVSEEPPGLPAAGVTFFGPPTPDGDELLGVGERDGDILLFCLEAETGIVRWEQLLAAAGRRLTEDLTRRSWTAPVAVRGSLVICPTTTGWVTAVDRISRRIVWSQRIIERASTSSSSSEFDLAFDAPNRDVGLDERWPPLQPIMLRDRVIIAPIELPDESGATRPRLLCFDLMTGDKLWEITKDQMIGVIGATDERIYLFDRMSIQAYRCDTGALAWKCSRIEAPIAGRPILTSSGLVVPTEHASLVLVELTQGKVIERLQVEGSDKPHSRLNQMISPNQPTEIKLGDLISLGGRLISVSPFEMVAFEWKSDEVQWQADASTDARSAIRWAKSLAIRGQISEAIQTLRDAAPLVSDHPSSSAEVKSSLTSLLLHQAELQLQEAKPDAKWQDWLSEASTANTSPVEQESIQRLEIELSLHSGEWDAAWSQIRTAIRKPLRHKVVRDQRVMSADVWLADQIRVLAQIPDRGLSDVMRESIHQEFAERWKEAEASDKERLRLARLFAETPFVDRTELDSLVPIPEAARLARLLALSQSRDQTTAHRASIQLIELLSTPDWAGEARRRLSDLPAAGSWPKDLPRTRAELEQQLERVTDVHRQSPSWTDAKIELLRKAESVSPMRDDGALCWIGAPCEALENYHYTYDQINQQIVIERTDGSRFGELPLSAAADYSNLPLSPVLYASGLNIYLVHSGLIHAFSVPDKQLLWKRNINQTSEDDPRRYSLNNQQDSLLNPPAFRDQRSNYEYRFQAATLVVASPRQVVVRSRRGIEVLCALTGELLWEMPRCPNDTVRCDNDRLYRFGGSKVIAYSLRSGRPLEVTGSSEFSNMLFLLDTSGITSLSDQSSEGHAWHFEGYQVRGETIPGRLESEHARWDEGDRLSLQLTWKLPVSAQSLIGAGPPGQGIWLDESGELKLIQWATGRVQTLGKTETLPLPEGHADADKFRVSSQWDRSRIYLLTNTAPEEPPNDIPAIPVHGSVQAFSRERFEREWSFEFEGHLLTGSLRNTPVLPLVKLEESQVAGYPYQKVHLLLLDKPTGKVVYELKTKSFGSGIMGSQYFSKGQVWKLFLQGEIMQFRRQPAASP